MLEILATGYGLIEAPRVDPEGRLYWSDVTKGGVYRRHPDGAVETVVPRRRGVGGMVFHEEGGLVLSGRNVCHVRNGETRVLLERPEGVGGFNDLCTDAARRVIVGSLRSNPFGEVGSRTPGEVYRIDAGGSATVLYGDVGLSNGLGFSPDGRRLYHCDTAAGHIVVHDVDGDGRLSGRRAFAAVERGGPDGLAVDAEGGVWVASYGGGCVMRYTEDGRLDRVLEVPADQVTSLCFGGDGLRDLYIVTADHREGHGGTVFRTRAPVAGLEVPAARV